MPIRRSKYDHYFIICESSVTCRQCSKMMVRNKNGSTATMRFHLSRYHPTMFARVEADKRDAEEERIAERNRYCEMMRVKNGGSGSRFLDESGFSLNNQSINSDHPPPTLESILSNLDSIGGFFSKGGSSQQGHSFDQMLSTSSNCSNADGQNLESQENSARDELFPSTRQIDSAILRWISAEKSVSLALAESGPFKRFLSVCAPNYFLRSTAYFVDEVLPRCYADERWRVSKALQRAKHVNLELVGPIERGCTGLSQTVEQHRDAKPQVGVKAVIAHLIDDDFSPKRFLLDVSEGHSTVDEYLERVIDECHVDSTKIHMIIDNECRQTDRRLTAHKIMESFGQKLELSIKDGLTLVSDAISDLDESFCDFGADGSVDRWYQKYPFWQRNYDRFQFAVENRQRIEERWVAERRLLDWDAIESAAAAVEPLRDAVHTVVGRSDDNDDKWEPIGAVLSLYSALRDRLQLASSEDNVEGEEMILVESTLNRIKYGIRQALIERMSGLEENEDLLLAAVLDPFSRLDFLPESVADAAKRHLHAAAVTLARSCFGLLLDVGDKQANNENDLESEDVEKLAEEATLIEMAHSSAEKEVNDFITQRILFASQYPDVYQLWQSEPAANRFPLLKSLAHKYLIPLPKASEGLVSATLTDRKNFSGKFSADGQRKLQFLTVAWKLNE